MKITTRVGLIGSTDNRFLGRSVFEELSREMTQHGDALALVLGARLGTEEREALRLVALCTTSPDARVWPLKLCRLLSSYGDPVAGFCGAQLVSAGKIMGPGAAGGSAAGLVFVAARAQTDAALDAAVAEWRERNSGRFAGFGVPFRPEDERLLALRRFVAGTPLQERPYWRLQERVVAAMARQQPSLQPNVALGIAALLLDAGVPPERCGVALALFMTHVFAAHALEAARTDGATLNTLPPSVIDYQGVAPRSTATPGPPVPADPALRRHRSAEPTGGSAYQKAGK